MATMATAHHGMGGFAPRRRAAALLEVVIALSILLMAMSVIGVMFYNGLKNVKLAEQISRATILTQRLLGELDTGTVGLAGQETIGSFGDAAPPGTSYRVLVNPEQQIPGMVRAEIEIWVDDASVAEVGKRLLLTTHVLRAVPQGIDFQRDFGFSQDQLDMLTQAIPGGEAIFNPSNFDPRSIAKLPMDQLVQLLPTLLQTFGGGFMSGNMDQILAMLQKGDIAGLEKLAQQSGATGQGTGSTPNPITPGNQNGSQPPRPVTGQPKRPTGGGK